jgi:hypothetical protein
LPDQQANHLHETVAALSAFTPVQKKLKQSRVTNTARRANYALSCFSRISWPAGWNASIRRPATEGESSMKKLFLAIALIVAFAAPALAHEFPNYYATSSDTMHQ